MKGQFMKTALAHPVRAALPITPAHIRPIVALGSRTVLFALWQALIAALYALFRHRAPWDASVAWWPLTATLTNLVSIALLLFWLRKEGAQFWSVFQFERTSWKHDLLLVLGVCALSAPAIVLPSYFLATALFGNAAAAVDLYLRPLPLWAAGISLVGFPLTIALAELPTYFGYVMPRLGRGWGAVVACAFFLGLQHATLPLLFDWRFILWRASMFLPFALLLGIVLRWRPRLLPYLVVVHGLLDLQAAVTVLSRSL
jgi:hypothetical protein